MTKVILLSDTHNKHARITIPECDILIHCGDFSGCGRKSEVKNFLKWFNKQPANHLIYTAGNHDLSYSNDPILIDYGDKGKIPIHPHPGLKEEMLDQYSNITYLENSGIEVGGLKIWGSPNTPRFGNWAFGYERQSPEAEKIWAAIPNNLDILLTHGPPKGVLDKCFYDIPPHPKHAGCSVLKRRILETKPKIHAFGHVHEGGRQQPIYLGNTTCYNVSTCNLQYQAVNPPIEINLYS